VPPRFPALSRGARSPQCGVYGCSTRAYRQSDMPNPRKNGHLSARVHQATGTVSVQLHCDLIEAFARLRASRRDEAERRSDCWRRDRRRDPFRRVVRTRRCLPRAARTGIVMTRTYARIAESPGEVLLRDAQIKTRGLVDAAVVAAPNQSMQAFGALLWRRSRPWQPSWSSSFVQTAVVNHSPGAVAADVVAAAVDVIEDPLDVAFAEGVDTMELRTGRATLRRPQHHRATRTSNCQCRNATQLRMRARRATMPWVWGWFARL
jgi:hypothetical protein